MMTNAATATTITYAAVKMLTKRIMLLLVLLLSPLLIVMMESLTILLMIVIKIMGRVTLRLPLLYTLQQLLPLLSRQLVL